MREYYVALDIGGTNCRAALVETDSDLRANILRKEQLLVSLDYKSGVIALLGLIDRIAQEYPLTGIGGSFPGIIDQKNGEIRSATNLPDWNNKPIKQAIEKRFHVPTGIFHDVAAAAMGEALFGNGVGENNFVFLIWGTGVGGAKVERLTDKYHVTSFEPGHHIADPQGNVCACGLHGCPDLMMGGGPLGKRLNKDLADIKDDDPIWEEVAKIAGQTVINTLAFHQTPLLVFGGGLIQRRQFLLDKIRETISLHQGIYKIPKIRMAKLGDNAALFGTVALQQVDLI